jgi:cobalt-zinc-cadmium efflux system protein
MRMDRHVAGPTAAGRKVHLRHGPFFGVGRAGERRFIAIGLRRLAWEAVSRLASPPAVAGATVMGVAACGIVINGLSAWLLHAGSHGDLNRRSAYIHMLGDAAVSVGVLLSGAIILYTGWSRLDPIVSILIVAAILISTWGLLRDSLHLSLDGVPSSVNSSAVLSYLADQRGVTDVHDLHIWALSTVARKTRCSTCSRPISKGVFTSTMPLCK